MPDALAELRSAFPVAESWIYFNHAAVAPMARPVAEAIDAFCRDALHHGSVHVARWLDRREQARAASARLLGSSPEEVAVTTSTSQGLLTVAEGLRLSPGDEILVAQNDFPANQIPWFRQERRGARVVVVPRPGDRPLVAADVLERLTPRTRLVAVPFVFWDDGVRLDLVELGRGLAGHPALFCVDAIQGLGAFPLDVEAARIDFLSADSHKWMLGLEGVGLFYCREGRLPELDPPFQSWMSVVEPFSPYAPGRPLLPDARRFEYAALPTVAIFGLAACLELLLAAGVDALAARILQLTAQLERGLADAGWRVRAPGRPDAQRSGIVTAVPPAGRPEDACRLLEQRGVSVTPRGGGVRFSPHAWNTAGEVAAVLERLP